MSKSTTRPVGEITGDFTDARSLSDRSWLALSGVVALLIELEMVLRTMAGADRPPMAADAAIFQHAGWYMTNGGALYLDVWEPKPPLSYETTAILSLVADGDMLLFHLLNVALMVCVTVGIVLLVGRLAYELTGDGPASAVAGVSMFLLPGFALRPALGYKAKYLLLFAGLLAIYLALEDRPFAAGVAGAAAVGYWQVGAVFPLVALGLLRHDRRAVLRLVAGGLTLSAAMLAPVVASGALDAMLVQAVVVPLTISEHTSLLVRIYAGGIHFRFAAPLVLVGGLGLLKLGRDWRDTWWCLLPAIWFALTVLFLDFEVGGYTDLIPGLAFVAIGIGVVTSETRGDRRRLLVGAVALLVVFNALTLGGVAPFVDPIEVPDPEPMDDLAEPSSQRVVESPYTPENPHDVRYVFWNAIEPGSCHYRFSQMGLDWLALTDGQDSCRGGDATAVLQQAVH